MPPSFRYCMTFLFRGAFDFNDFVFELDGYGMWLVLVCIDYLVTVCLF